MLSRLRIENLGVFAEVEAEFAPGLNVITGETGAGKTMLLEGLRLVAGGKANAKLIGPRSGDAYVEAAFEAEVPEALAELADPGEELLLARRLRREGAARALCNGRGCSGSQLAEAASELLSLTGQHAARRLTSAAYQLSLLDRAAGLDDALAELARRWRAWQEAQRELDELRRALLDRESRLIQLEGEIEAFDGVEPVEGEEEQLAAEQQRLAHVESLAAQARELYEGLYGAEGSAVERVDVLAAGAERAGEHDPQMAELAKMLGEASEVLREAAEQARGLLEGYAADPQRLAEVEERILAIAELRRRFRGLEIEQIRERVEAARAELAELSDSDEALGRLEARVAEAQDAYRELADEISKKRRQAAKRLAGSVEEHLADLALPEARLLIELSEAKPGPRGRDAVSFSLQANPGLAPAPLGKGASGGELSRVNLALLLATATEGGTYFFDEVDAGIGGKTAHALAEKLAELAKDAQVIVITHLAQIAVRAERHLLVEKETSGELTETTLRVLEGEEERQAEIARLIGGDAEHGAAAAEMVRAGASS